MGLQVNDPSIQHRIRTTPLTNGQLTNRMMKRDNAERRRKTMRGCGGWASGGSVLRYHLTVVVLVLTLWSTTVSSIDLTKLLQHRTLKRTVDACHPYEPFKCPGDGACISIQYLCVERVAIALSESQ